MLVCRQFCKHANQRNSAWHSHSTLRRVESDVPVCLLIFLAASGFLASKLNGIGRFLLCSPGRSRRLGITRRAVGGPWVTSGRSQPTFVFSWRCRCVFVVFYPALRAGDKKAQRKRKNNTMKAQGRRRSAGNRPGTPCEAGESLSAEPYSCLCVVTATSNAKQRGRYSWSCTTTG